MLDFEKNKFNGKILEEYAKIIIANFNKKTKRKKTRRTQKLIFYEELFSLIREINLKITDLNACVILIGHYPNNKPLRRIFKKCDYITYHLEYYYISIICIYDRLLKLINFLYDLGLKDKYTTKDIILSNKKVDSKVVKILKSFDNGISEIRTMQNLIKHKSKYIDKKISEIRGFEYLKDYIELNKSKKTSWEKISSIELNIRMNYSKYLSDKKKDLKKNNKKIIKSLEILYKILEKQLEYRIKEFN